MQSRIRIANRPNDARAIARIHVDSWQATYGNGLLPQSYLDRLSVPGLTQRWQRRLASRYDGYSVRVAEAAGNVVGFAEFGPCLQDNELLGFAAEVYMLYVHPDVEGQGIGRALLTHALDELADQGFYWVIIWVVAGNRSARAFYHLNGLRPDGVTRIDRFARQKVGVMRYAKALNPVIDLDALLQP